MNILIVGVSGFIGRHLYKALSQDGHNITGCSRYEVNDINWKNLISSKVRNNGWSNYKI